MTKAKAVCFDTTSKKKVTFGASKSKSYCSTTKATKTPSKAAKKAPAKTTHASTRGHGGRKGPEQPRYAGRTLPLRVMLRSRAPVRKDLRFPPGIGADPDSIENLIAPSQGTRKRRVNMDGAIQGSIAVRPSRSVNPRTRGGPASAGSGRRGTMGSTSSVGRAV